MLLRRRFAMWSIRGDKLAAQDRFALAAIRREKPGSAGRPNHAMRGHGFLSRAAARLLPTDAAALAALL